MNRQFYILLYSITMRPLEKSPAARGLVTLAINDFMTPQPRQKQTIAYNDFIDSAQVEISDYDTGERVSIAGGIGLLCRSFGSEFQQVLREYIQLVPGSIEKTAGIALRKIEMLKLGNIQRLIQGNHWDVFLLLNGHGLPLEMCLLIDAFVHEQHDKTNITTLTTVQARSALGILFGVGNRRIAMPSTNLMLHSAIDENTKLPKNIEGFPLLQKYMDDPIQKVQQETHGQEKVEISQRYKKACEDPSNQDRKFLWEAQETPGYVTEYLTAKDPLSAQMETLIERPIKLLEFEGDSVARFILESEVKRISKERGLKIGIYSVKNTWNIVSKETSDITQAQTIVREILQSLGGHGVTIE